MGVKPRLRLAIALAAVCALALLVAIFLLFGPRPPQTLTLAAQVDEGSRAALAAALLDYNSEQNRYRAELAPPGSSAKAELLLGPWSAGSLLWRSQGWRLWTRLETLARLESEEKRPLILPLRGGRVDGADFAALLADFRKAGLPSLVLPSTPASYPRALGQYLGRLGLDPERTVAEWTAKGWILRVPNLGGAVEAIRDGRAVFVLASDAMGGFLGSGADIHAEGLPLPGSADPAGPWAIGRADAFTFPSGDRPSEGALDLATWLTSKGLARRFSASLPGLYYSWTVPPVRGQAPAVDGPLVFLDPET